MMATHHSGDDADLVVFDMMDIDDPSFIASLNQDIKSYRQELVESGLSLFEFQTFGSLPYGPAPDTNKQQDCDAVLVIDTNVFISHLQFCKRLIAALTPRTPLMVPYVVVKELDSLKTSSRSSDNGPTVGYLARSAATFLLQCLKNNSSTVRGQRLDERLSFEHDSTINNDDRILECCRFSQRNMSSNVFLLTQDTILATKGEIHGIKSTSNFKVPVEKFLSSLLMAPSASTSEEILQHHAWEKPVSNRERTSIGNPSRRDSLPSPNDAMDIDVHKTQIEQANIRSVRKPLDPIDSVLHEILAMFVPSLKPALTAVFLRNGLKFPSFPSESDVRGNRRSPPCDSEEEHILYVVEAHWLFLKRDSTEGTGVYASSFKNDIPYLRSLLKDMARVRNRGIGAMNKGDLTTFLRLAPPLWDVCTAAGFPHDHSRALNLLQGWRVKLST